MNIETLKDDINFYPWHTPTNILKYIQEHSKRNNQYVGYIDISLHEVVLRIWAFRETKQKGLQYTEVERKTPSEMLSARRNIYLTSYSGWHPVYEPKTHASGNWYGYNYYYFDGTDFNQWYAEAPMGISYKIINCDDVFKLDKYKYCGYSGAQDIISYLREYNKNPKVEYFGKLGLRYSKVLENKAKKDKQFVRFLQENARDISLYGPSAAVLAYDEKISVEEARRIDERRRRHNREVSSFVPEVKGTRINRERLYEYLNAFDDWGLRRSYNDYLRAIKYIGLDLSDTKNVFPKDFQRMHDLRINEYKSALAKADEEKRRELFEKFAVVSSLYKRFEEVGDKYTIVIPDTPTDLVNEGEYLHHCVGRMGYDEKFANGRSIIAFVRVNGDIKTPYVTVEYLVKEKIVAQCYADHDSKPEAEVIKFVNAWGEKVKEGLKEHDRKAV